MARGGEGLERKNRKVVHPLDDVFIARPGSQEHLHLFPCDALKLEEDVNWPVVATLPVMPAWRLPSPSSCDLTYFVLNVF